jgi:hypothetical protein
MELLDKKTDKELLDSLMAEVAKSSNEIKCAQQDIAKVQSRLSFALVLINELRAKHKV